MFSVYSNFIKTNYIESFDEIINIIQSNVYESDINSIRYAYHSQDFEKGDNLKKTLPAFTTSGTFGESRTREFLETYTQIIGLDFDDIPVTEVEDLRSVVNNCEYTFASFVSPSGMGLKVFVKIDTTQEKHEIAYNQVANHYKEITGYKFDVKCKDITRLCFFSYDEKAYLNHLAIIYNVKDEIQKIEIQKNAIEQVNNKFISVDDKLDFCLKFTEHKENYHEGNRNNFIYLFSANANKFGISQADTENFCITNFDLSEKEIKATINSAYKHQFQDFAKFEYYVNNELSKNDYDDLYKVVNNEEDIEEESILRLSPKIPYSVYETLPLLLQNGSKVFKTSREKDVFLTSALSIISGCLPDVSGLYMGGTIYPNLFSFVLAPAASGKGTMKYAKMLADDYHKRVLDSSKELQLQYEMEMQEFKLKKDKAPNELPPKEPKFQVVFIPANVSNARVIQHLDWNEGKGIICETEADTLGQTFKNDWGGYSDMLRKAFHHEKISSSRKTNGEFVEVNEPQLSVTITGTPKQIFGIIPSAEDGLFSRFMYYVFKTETKWLDPSPKSNPVNLSEHFKSLSKEVLQMVDFLTYSSTTIHLSEKQWESLNTIFEEYLKKISNLISDEAESVVYRLGVIVYRFCMIFTAIRKAENKQHGYDFECTDIDFNNAIILSKVYLEHSILLFNNLPKQANDSNLFKVTGTKKQILLQELPKSFKRDEAIKLAEKYNLKARTVDNFLKKLVDSKILTQPDYGFYEKVV